MPTALRLAEARRRGVVARSSDLSSTAVILGAFVLLGLAGTHLLAALRDMTAALLGDHRAGPGELPAAASVLWPAVGPVLGLLLGVAGGLVGVAILAGVAQVGLLSTTEPVRPDFSRLSPAAGLRRMFSLRSLVRVGLAVAKLTAASLLCYVAIRPVLAKLMFAPDVEPQQLMTSAAGAMGGLAIRLGLVLLALAMVDFMYQRWQRRQDLKMTRREVLEDLKRTEGSPLIRSRRRQLARQAGSQRLAVEVPRASVVITDGENAAVALRYKDGMVSPR
ncbi:MAG: EscU/YscU/HrcU family type III secretion system export apparatus switch protein, partial [Phycisphaerae bacterium]|nr:EscU/YscU/HrcU family type III secretion system export apparatus switch protein [Phycisphaerae bacterium]